ncbi:phage tail tape measure protein [Serratia bockelmannii]|uniref:phage tail tape measure protein n=1 Tax=Serratia bockelmannii TaxID=2703793 RepID=UPI003FA7E241
MSGPFETQVGIGVKDSATPAIRRIRNEVQRMQEARERLGVRGEHTIRREIQLTEASLNRMARSGTLGAAELARAQEKAATKIAQLQKEMAKAEVSSYATRNTAREAYTALGIKSEHSIRREIQRTEAAYNRLERSGVLSASEQARAYEKMTSTVGKLRRELGETERTQSRLAAGLKTGFRVAGGIGAGIMGAGMVLRAPIGGQMDYDSELRRTANFLYRDQGLQGRLAGVRTIDNRVRAATRYGGGTPEEAIDAADMMARSKMNRQQVFAALPEVMKIHSATGAGAEDIASLMTSTYNFGLSDKEASAALDAATTAAQNGRADVPILAREVPRGLESAKSAGLSGKHGYAQTLALFEVAASVAGGATEGATNANDLLAELSSNNLKNNAKRIKIGGKKIDFQAMAIKDVSQGLTPLDTLSHLVDKYDQYDPAGIALRRKFSHATSDSERQRYQDALSKMHGDHVSAFLTNQQSRNAFYGYERNRDMFGRITNDVEAQFNLPEGQRSTDIDFGVVKDSNSFKVSQAKNEQRYATNDAVKGTANVLGDLAEKGAHLAEEFPKLAEAAAGAAVAIKALAAAAILKEGAGLLTGGGGGGLLGKVLRQGGAAAGEAAEVAAGTAAGHPGWLSRAGSAVWRGVTGAGKSVVLGGKSLVTDGVLEDGLLANPWVAGALAAVLPSDTVGGHDEMAELQRLKQRNQQRNTLPSSSEALSLLQNWQGHSGTSGGAPVVNLPAQPAPAVNVRVLLDSRDIASAIEVLLEKNSRRYGA